MAKNWLGFVAGVAEWCYILEKEASSSAKFRSPFPEDPEMDRGFWIGAAFARARSRWEVKPNPSLTLLGYYLGVPKMR